MQVVTGYLSIDELDNEIDDISAFLVTEEILVVYVTFGIGCIRSDLGHNQNYPVSSSLLPEFIYQQEEDGIFYLGKSDLYLKSEDNRIKFLLCEESDIHCYTNETELFDKICDKWSIKYSNAYLIDEITKSHRPLRG